jgi:hypothetical protein
VTVREVLALARLRGSPLLAGEASSDRRVSRVRPMPETREAGLDYGEVAIVLDGSRLVDNDYVVDLALRC